VFRRVQEDESPAWGERGFLGKHGSGDRLASEVCLWISQKGSKQQRRRSGIYSLGGAAVKLDMQFPSAGLSAQPAKRFNDFGERSGGPQRGRRCRTSIPAQAGIAQPLDAAGGAAQTGYSPSFRGLFDAAEGALYA
jgi:hypothetical protein